MSVTLGKLLSRLNNKIEEANVELPRGYIRILTQLVFKEIGDALAAGEDVFIEGFGRFYPDYRPSRRVRSGITGHEHVAEPKVFIRFNAFDKLSSRVQAYLGVLGFTKEPENESTPSKPRVSKK